MTFDEISIFFRKNYSPQTHSEEFISLGVMHVFQILSDSDPKYILDQPPRPILDSGDFPSLLDPWFPSNLTYSQVSFFVLPVFPCHPTYHHKVDADVEQFWCVQAQRDEQALMYIGRTNSGATQTHTHAQA